jgi:outer membrane protein
MGLLGAASSPCWADTLNGALKQAYEGNPQLNIQRAIVRATDENVPQALAGYRPRVSASSNVGIQSLSTTTRLVPAPLRTPATYFTQSGENTPHSVGVTATQTLLNGFQTANSTRQAESQVLGAREALRSTEQTVLLNAATVYMNLLRDTAGLGLQRRNVEVLQEQVRNTRDRFKVGDATQTDLSQAESRLFAGRAQLLASEANYTSSVASYRQIIGTEPGVLSPGIPVDRFLASTVGAAIETGLSSHPNVNVAQFNLDVAESQVKVAEGSLYPTVSLQLTAQKNWELSLPQIQSYAASAVGAWSLPIYQGGAEYAVIRQAKETVGQRRIELDLTRDQIRQAVIQAWALLVSAKGQIPATEAQVQSAEMALNGVREEARVGQRTTLDVLNAQQELVNARAALVSAQRDRVVASYTLLAAIGRMSPQILGLSVASYDPRVHYHQVRDAWTGVRTPEGR